MAKKQKMDKDDEERLMKFIEKQVKRGEKISDEVVYTELKRARDDEKIKVDLNLLSKKSNEDKIFAKPIKILSKNRKFEKKTQTIPGTSKRKSALDEIQAEEERRKEKKNRKDYWICTNIVVKVMTKSLGDKYYKKKGIIEGVQDHYIATVRMIESNNLLKIDQEHLESVIPSEGRQVKILNGAYRGENAILKEIHQSKFCATLEISSGLLKGRIIKNIQYEDFSKIHIQ